MVPVQPFVFSISQMMEAENKDPTVEIISPASLIGLLLQLFTSSLLDLQDQFRLISCEGIYRFTFQ